MGIGHCNFRKLSESILKKIEPILNLKINFKFKLGFQMKVWRKADKKHNGGKTINWDKIGTFLQTLPFQ